MSQSIPRPLHPHETPSQIAKAGYDQHAQTYLNWKLPGPDSRIPYLNQVLDLLAQTRNQDQLTSSPQKISVLDLGCGAGVPVTLNLAKSDMVQHVVSTDISRTQLDLLRQMLQDEESAVAEKVEIIESDMLGLSFEEKSLNAVVACFSIIHLARKGQKVMLERIWKWLKVGGCLCVNFGAQADDEEGVENGSGSTGHVVEGWLGMIAAYWDSFGSEKSQSILKEIGFELLVAEVVKNASDADFLWVIARKGSSSQS